MKNYITQSALFVAVVCLAVAGIFPIFASRRDRGGHEKVPQHLNKLNLSVQDPRPVAKAIMMLEGRYGWVITYEDPRYSYAGDIADVTEKVRRDLHKYRKGGAPRVLIPKGGELSFQYNVNRQTNLPINPGDVVQQLLDAQSASANAGRFRMEQHDKIIHVIPSAVNDRSGTLMPQQSILDTVVTLAEEERTALKTLESLCGSITRVTQTRVVVGSVPLGLFLQHKDRQRIVGKTAREVLVQLFKRIDNEIKLSWQVLYDPGTKMYVINIHMV